MFRYDSLCHIHRGICEDEVALWRWQSGSREGASFAMRHQGRKEGCRASGQTTPISCSYIAATHVAADCLFRVSSPDLGLSLCCLPSEAPAYIISHHTCMHHNIYSTQKPTLLLSLWLGSRNGNTGTGLHSFSLKVKDAPPQTRSCRNQPVCPPRS